MCVKVSSRSQLDVLERRQNCLKPVLRRELISYGRVLVSNGSPNGSRENSAFVSVVCVWNSNGSPMGAPMEAPMEAEKTRRL